MKAVKQHSKDESARMPYVEGCLFKNVAEFLFFNLV